MVIKDKELNDLVKQQTDMFEKGASIKEREDILKKIQKRQKELMKYRAKEEG